MKKSDKEKQRLKDGTHRKCLACRKTEPISKWAFNPNGGIWACSNCGSLFHDPDMIKITIIEAHIGNKSYPSFEKYITHVNKIILAIGFRMNSRMMELFKIRYNSNKIITKQVHMDDVNFEWPFTIDNIILKCYGKGKAITVINPTNNIEYVLNGAAGEQGFESIQDIWRESENGLHISLSGIIAYIADDYK
jgi:ribosomal protein L37AE/L43A